MRTIWEMPSANGATNCGSAGSCTSITRGTAATRLLDAGADLKKIATKIGWAIQHAAEVFARDVALSARMTDQLAAKPNAKN